MDDSYLDYLSNMSKAEMGDSLKDLMRDYYELFKPYLEELFHVESNCIYLNLICGVSQTKIGETMGISQYGVSKRVRGGLNKLSHLLKIPEKHKETVKADFDELLASHKSETLFLYYFLRTFALTARILNMDPNVVNSMVLSSMSKLKDYSQTTDLKSFIKVYLESHELKIKSFKELEHKYKEHYDKLTFLRENPDELDLLIIKASRYHTYLEGLLENSSYGDYTFKFFDKARTKAEEDSCQTNQ